MMTDTSIAGYVYDDGELNASHDYLLPALKSELGKLNVPEAGRRAFDLGCGNGSIANAVSQLGWDVTGIDASDEGIANAKIAHPHLKLSQGSAYDDLAAAHGQFPVVYSFEVVEHVYAPRDYARTLYNLIEPGGTAIISTPYHGYWKNLVMAATGKMDAHFTALWDHGHIKFWSYKTLTVLLEEAGFTDIKFSRVGRIAPLAKSMVATARKK